MHITIQVPGEGLGRRNNLPWVMKIQGRDWIVGLNGKGMPNLAQREYLVTHLTLRQFEKPYGSLLCRVFITHIQIKGI